MNFRGGFALIKKSLLGFMASKGFFWTLSIGWMMGPVVYLFAWMIAAGGGKIGSFGRSDFIFYYLALILVNQFNYPSSHWTVGENIQLGTMSNWLLRPLPVIYEAISSDIALKIVCMPFVAVIVAALGGLFGFAGFVPVVAWKSAALFLPAFLLAWVLRFLLAYILSLLAFWTQKIHALLAVNDTLILLFSGQIAPTMLLPGPFRAIAAVLPFRYMLGFPIEVLSGKLTAFETITGLMVQAGWLLAFLLLHRLVWKSGIKRYCAIGG
jgi:ABC-2 type transport system permease protein